MKPQSTRGGGVSSNFAPGSNTSLRPPSTGWTSWTPRLPILKMMSGKGRRCE